ncbi:MAG: hypothetical protein AAF598_08720 [Bacteroidota bacterium]
MSEQTQHLETLAEIRTMMERSSRFLSLSGLSGVAAGLCALGGALAVYLKYGLTAFTSRSFFEGRVYINQTETIWFLLLTGLVVITTATALGCFFTWRKAKRFGYKIFDKTATRLAWNLAIPLLSGGIFCLILMFEHYMIEFVAPATLVFYGLTLVNASKYTLNDIRYLGYLEIGLGLLSLYFVGYGMFFWTIGFGVLHIVYGILMWFKYERG